VTFLLTNNFFFSLFSPDNEQSSGGTVATFTVFVNSSAFEVTPELLGTAFRNELRTQIAASTTKSILGNDYVLATSSDGVNFTPSLDNVVGKRFHFFIFYYE
jgi:hypothetical protein